MNITPEMDADGNPIAPGGEEVKLTKEEFDKLVNSSAESKQALANVVNEIKEMRTLNADLKKKVEEAPESTTDIQKAVEQELARREKDSIQSIYAQATEGFLAAHPEFSQENDPGGIKLTAFQKSLGRISLNGLKTKEQFDEALSDALSLMERKTNLDSNIVLPPSSKGNPALPRVASSYHLPPAEEKLVKAHFNGDVEKYLVAKAKRPAYFEELLQWAR